MRTRQGAMIGLVACGLLLALVTPALCQGPEDLGLGDLGGLGGLGGGLGLLGPALGGMLRGGAGAAAAPATTVVIQQPALLLGGDSIYLAYNGKLLRLDAKTLKKQAEFTYAAPATTGAGAVHSTSAGPLLLDEAPAAAKPPLVPGAKPAAGPQG